MSCLYAEIAFLPAQETRFGTLGSVHDAAPDHRQAWVLEYPVLVLGKSHSEPSGVTSASGQEVQDLKEGKMRIIGLYRLCKSSILSDMVFLLLRPYFPNFTAGIGIISSYMAA
jgi:hypothetical protein